VIRLKYAAFLIVLTGAASFAAGCGAEQDTVAPDFSTAPLIDPNTAPESALSAVPGLSSAGVSAIVAGRPFSTPTELHAVIGEELSEEDQRAVYTAMFIKVSLNSGAEADYKLIPSTLSPGKLAHELEEYRPYESMDQFRREMSKYVSDEEVAHLSRYVTLD
jgi:hypothetical protein